MICSHFSILFSLIVPFLPKTFVHPENESAITEIRDADADAVVVKEIPSVSIYLDSSAVGIAFNGDSNQTRNRPAEGKR